MTVFPFHNSSGFFAPPSQEKDCSIHVVLGGRALALEGCIRRASRAPVLSVPGRTGRTRPAEAAPPRAKGRFTTPFWYGGMEPSEQKLFLLKPPWSCLRGQPVAAGTGPLAGEDCNQAVRAHEKLQVDMAGAIESKTHTQGA